MPDRFAPIPAGGWIERFDDGLVCVLQGATWASVSGVTVGDDEVADLVVKVRALVAPEKQCMWWLGPSVRPAGLPDRLRSHGLVEPHDRVPVVRALALTREPGLPPPDVDVHVVTAYDEFTAAREVQWEAFSVPEERRTAMRRRMEEDFEETLRNEVPVGFVALVDGQVAATATAVPSERGVFLIAGATAPWARGRGLYRALVHARWEYAVKRGTPALVTQADPSTSYPILKRLGFEDVCDIDRLEDRRQSSNGATAPDS